MLDHVAAAAKNAPSKGVILLIRVALVAVRNAF
jgi:hypothetical protein